MLMGLLCRIWRLHGMITIFPLISPPPHGPSLSQTLIPTQVRLTQACLGLAQLSWLSTPSLCQALP